MVKSKLKQPITLIKIGDKIKTDKKLSVFLFFICLYEIIVLSLCQII